MTHVVALTNQTDFIGRENSGNEATPTWLAAANVDWTQDTDASFRVRFVVAETAGADAAITPSLEFNLNGGGWVAVGVATAIQWGAFIGATDGDATTQQVGAGSFVAGELDSDGTHSTVTLNNSETETEYCLTVDSAQVANNDTLQLRVTDGGTAFDAYTNTPTITVAVGATIAEGAGSAAGSSTASGALVDGASNFADGAGTATGGSTVTGSGEAIATISGLSSGSTSASGAGEVVVPTAGAASGSSTVLGVGEAVVSTAGLSSGGSTALGVGEVIATGAGLAAGSTTVLGVAAAIATAVGSAAGSSTVTGYSPVIGGVVRKAFYGDGHNSGTVLNVAPNSGIILTPRNGGTIV